MRKTNISILTIILVSSILRIIALGSVPLGLSLDEISLASKAAAILGYVPSEFLLRLPFAILGVISVYLIYPISMRLFKDVKVSLLGCFLLAVAPWHIAESRIFSQGIIILTLTQVVILSVLKNKALTKYFRNIYLPVYIIFLLLVGMFVVPVKGVAERVNTGRHLISEVSSKYTSRIFINKYVTNFTEREKIVFDNLDYGNYFFSGHPRERWGFEEKEKIFFTLIPFFLAGILFAGKENIKYLSLWSLAALVFLSFFPQSPSLTLVIIIPLTILVAFGIKIFLASNNKTYRPFLYALILLSLFEFFNFTYRYFYKNEDSIFSPRRPYYKDIAVAIEKNRDKYRLIVVTDRLKDASGYLYYYLKGDFVNLQVKYFNIKQITDNEGILFVDVVPYEPGPTEPLYSSSGGYPNGVNVVREIDNKYLREKIVLYTYEKYDN